VSGRTVCDFTASADIWHIVEPWAERSKYDLKRSSDLTRLYQRGHGVILAPMMLEISQTGDKVHIEAWVRTGFLQRLLALFLIPSEMGIDSGGFRLVLPRKTARTAVNELLAQFQHPPIE
jgi:hypothetical protein